MTRRPTRSLPTTDRPLLTSQEAADYLGCAETSLRYLRSAKARRAGYQGPLYARMRGVGVRYMKADLDAYITASMVKPKPLPMPLPPFEAARRPPVAPVAAGCSEEPAP